MTDERRDDMVERVLDFWLVEVGEDGWYQPPDGLDDRVRALFLDDWDRLHAAPPAPLAPDPRTALARIILTDQFPRNMFRGSARAFATDPLARAIAAAALEAGHDLETEMPQRHFFYMPLEHSEDAADQDRAVALIGQRTGSEEFLLHARAHREIILRFGRFPFRNDALGRETTTAERAFLDGGGYGEIVRDLRTAGGGDGDGGG